MIRAGLTGGLASGKSFVGRLLADFGCIVIRADELGHRALARGGEVYTPVVKLFGEKILAADNEIDRKRLATEVFSDPEKLRQLNLLVHPIVFRLEDELLAEAERRDPQAIGVVEAAILVETGSYKRFDRLILVACSPSQQVERAIARGMTHDEAMLRLERQMPLEEKRKFADFVIDTSGEFEETAIQTQAVYDQLRSLRK
ncbi:MAG: dephospho-CoA kinase [Bryobacteraceae bacterium]